MFGNGRKTIGLFVFIPTGDYQSEICRAAAVRAEELGYNLAVFSSYGAYGNTGNAHERGEMTIFDLPDYRKLAGIIIALDTFSIPEAREQVLRHIREQSSCPVVSLRERLDGANNILIREGDSMEEITRHIIEEHGKKDIAFMSGPKDREDAEARLTCFRNVMGEYGYETGEHRIFYGDFWRGKGKEACDWFSSDGTYPEAIVCANDHMALSVIDELYERNIRVPEDVLVTGYDGLKEGIRYQPTLTTSGIDFRNMACEAVDMIDRHQNDDAVEERYVSPKLIQRESCGCFGENSGNAEKRYSQHKLFTVNENLEMQFGFMAIDLSGETRIGDLHRVISKYIYNFRNFQHYYVCLRDDIEESGNDFSGCGERMHVRVAVRDRHNMGETDIPVEKGTMLPPEVTDETPQCFFFIPVHYREMGYGYEAYSFSGKERYGKIHERWSIAISNAIYNIIAYNRMNALIRELENLYVQDVLTGLYNRHGFEKYACVQFSRAQKERNVVCVIGIDMDGLKPVNDIYGHNEGDSALRAVACAIREAAVPGQIGARIGGDEFEVFFPCGGEKDVRKWVDVFQQSLERYNQKSGKPYEVHASVGYRVGIPGTDDTMEGYMKESDDLMYKNKVENKRRRNEALR